MAKSDDTPVPIEVAYAGASKQQIKSILVTASTTVGEAIRKSEIMLAFTEIDLTRQSVGIYGRLVSLNAIVNAGDRIEIYRELTVDPKARRRLRSRSK